MRNSSKKRFLALLMALVLCFAVTGCKKDEPANNNSPLPPESSSSQPGQDPTDLPVPSQPEATAEPTASPEPTAAPTAEPTASPEPTAAPVAAAWKTGYYEKNAGSAAYIALSITTVGKDSFAFSIDAKGITVSGTALYQTDGTARYAGSDCTLVFGCLAKGVTVTEEVAVNPNILLGGTYTPSK